jgi:protein-tyrosine phosphatase
MSRTSVTDPIILNPIATGNSGQNILYLTLAPGKVTPKSFSSSCGWNRNLDEDLIRMKDVYHIDELISLLEPAEAIKIGLANYSQKAAEHGIIYRNYPIPDLSIPSQPLPEFDQFIRSILTSLDEGRNIAVHCLGGLGRGGTIVSAVLMASDQSVNRPVDQSVDQAIKWVQQQRPGSIKRKNQQQFLKRYGQYLQTL